MKPIDDRYLSGLVLIFVFIAFVANRTWVVKVEADFRELQSKVTMLEDLIIQDQYRKPTADELRIRDDINTAIELGGNGPGVPAWQRQFDRRR